ncbi:TPA: Xaa-Pro aminopeptidase [Pasteurella multocida]|uniref:Xaa-Pro aminopeptidase n=1 Tax=Pasteurella multocida TaxID=747 RepID=A0A849CL67_PASMD|nr:Xaa-Pro aminopeptidase [Pasteurella multocida]AFF25347.1 Xaa-Pro aminopeptidase [Pasteurella multocida subsp. multocida str. HN06]AFI47171.1 Xaa-Pro aminopeptidase [Pasteurella multocida subsp. multocida str. 3480]AWW53045.1 Xaa-Pro aminopeptidase [Pasteurella multocida]EPE71224.1 Xaa-Pro aminopeptidase [Pasteurella multocida 671/90]MCH1905202.1 Xaa-Pro aminopeptidase [Pasteurella multocida]
MDLAYMAAMPQEEFAERRHRVFQQMQEDSVLIVFSEIEKRRSNDCTYPFRQDSYFWYLTGFNEPNSVLILAKHGQTTESIIFVRPSDPLRETWDGRRLGVANAPQKLQLDRAFSIEDFHTELPKILAKSTALYHVNALHPWGDALLAENDINLETTLCWKGMLDEMRLFKSNNEIALMQQAGQISALAHIRAMQKTRPNRLEYEIEGELLHEFNRFGARFPSYNAIVAGGENACILHYTENDMPLKDGDLVLIDAGCEFAMYAGDITRTFPVNGKFSQAQREIYDIVLKAQKRAIELLVPGNSIQQANDEVVRIKVEGLVKLGILQGDVETLIQNETYRQFYMHGLGHWLGLDVHDVGSYSKDQQNNNRNSKVRDRPLEVGMVLTVEPGLYISEQADVPEQYKGIGIRIEDNLLITEYGNKNLTSAVPKEIDEIEKLMAGK